MNSERYLSVLNPEQLQAVTHTGSPLLILAGAGSGKTRVITTKIAWLIGEQGLDPESILAVTFTNKAAREMRERAARLEPRAERSVLRTFHSFGAWLLRRNAAEVGLDAAFSIYDDDDAVTLLTRAMPALNRQQAALAVHKISRAKDYCLDPDSPLLSEIDPDPDFPILYRTYQNRLRETGNLDFGDLILLPVRLMRENTAIRERLRARFPVILVDEYQDSNVAQFELLRELTGPDTYLCVVGDDDQSIYRFRGAEVRNILTFPELFSGTAVIRLVRNYRSVAPVLSVADSVVAHNKGRLGKTLIAERGVGKKPVLVFLGNQDDEAAFAAELIINARSKGTKYEDLAVLYRTNAQSLGFETEFLHRGIPYRVVGSLKFYEREEIKDALALLALVVNGRDEVAFFRVVNKPARGIGETSRDRILAEARRILHDTPEGTQETILDFDERKDLLTAARAVMGELPKKGRAGLAEFLHIVEQLRRCIREKMIPQGQKDGSATDLGDFVESLIESSGLLTYHQGQDEVAGTQRVANLQELVNAASLYPHSPEGLIQFLEHIELDRSLSDEQETTDAVTLITVHNTKGLEFRRVIITGLETGVFPREDKRGDDLEEERRLMYVGCTRAMDELYLTSCASRRLYGRTAFMEPSLFLSEIEPSALEIVGQVPSPFRLRFLSGKVATVASSVDPLDERWKLGRRLFHDEYGYGQISKAFYAGDELVVNVRFESGGERRFMPRYQAKDLLFVEE